MNHCVKIHFHRQLASLLPRGDRNGERLYRFVDRPSVKDAIEACGVPHTEVDAILIDGVSVDFGWSLTDGAQVNVYPYGFSPRQEHVQHLCPLVQGPVTFILDVHLGKLARRLRLLGFDCRYRNDYDDPELIRLAQEEQRVILTRDRGILKHAKVRYGLLIRSSAVNDQTLEVLKRFELVDQIRPFIRCTACNGLLEIVAKEKVFSRLLPRTARFYHEFHRCRICSQLYWQGSHYQRIAQWIEAVKSHC